MAETSFRYLAMEMLSGLIGEKPAALGRAARATYRKRQVKKRSSGYRTIYVPPPELKRIQRSILKYFLPRFAKLNWLFPEGIKKGSSYLRHAEAHKDAKWLLKLDLKDAFPSTPIGLIRQRLVDKLIFSDPTRIMFDFNRVASGEYYEKFCAAIADLVLELTTCDGILPQGAPTSPWLFALVASDMLDSIWMSVPAEWRVTMYVDNIVISGPKPIRADTEGEINSIVEFYGFCLNSQKRSQTRTSSGCRITGLSIVAKKEGVSDGKVVIPKKVRRRMRAVFHQARSDPNLLKRAQGFIAYATSIYGHPDFFPGDIGRPYKLLMAQIAPA